MEALSLFPADEPNAAAADPADDLLDRFAATADDWDAADDPDVDEPVDVDEALSVWRDDFDPPPAPPGWADSDGNPDPAAVPAGLLDGLNPEQTAAVTTFDGPLLVVAGPGSGKTRVLTHRIAALVATGAWPSSILSITFTNKAAEEMRERLGPLIGDDRLSRAWIGTFHSVALRILRRHGTHVGLPAGFTVADTDAGDKLIKKILDDLGLGDENAREFRSKISYRKNQGVRLDELSLSSDPDDRALTAVWTEYQRTLHAMGMVDFDDILLLAARLLRTNAELRARYAKRFRWVSVDEFQDTNAVQLELVQLLSGSWGNVMCVGDARQSIYSWRGANRAVLDRFDELWPDATVVHLDRNYRSTPQIVDVADSIIAHAPGRHAGTLRTDNPDGEPVRYVTCDSDRSEADMVVAGVKALRADETCAVIFRTNAQSRPFEQALRDAGISYHVVGSVKFFERAEIKDALAHLRFAVNPRDQLSLERAAGAPKIGVGPAAIAELVAASAAHGGNLAAALVHGVETAAFSGRSAKGLARLAESVTAVRAAALLGPADAVTAAVRATGLRDALKEIERVENVDALISAAAQWDPADAVSAADGNIPAGWDATVAWVESVTMTEATDDDGSDQARAPRVQLMTGHAAKGREFDAVWVVGVEEDLFPHAMVAGDAAAVEEEARLLFVAVTRARHKLCLSSCEERWKFRDVVVAMPSPFLDTLPDHVVTRRQTGRPANAGYAKASFDRRRPGQPHVRPSRPSGPRRQTSTPRQVTRPSANTLTRSAAKPPTSGPRLRADQVSAGDTVNHPVFGDGTVTRVGTDDIAVAFADKNRVLALALAPLELR